MRLTLALLSFLLCSSLFANVNWELRVNQPNFDVQAHKLGNDQFKPYLDKTSWRCWAEKPTKSGNLNIRALRCNYSIEASGEFKSFVSCGPGKNFDEIAVELKDERKNLDLKVFLSCRFSSAS